VVKRQFGISTHLYHGKRLAREHLLEIAAHGFDAVEVFATRSHFDYENEAVVADLQQWLGEAGLDLLGIHAPIASEYSNGRLSGTVSIASSDAAERAAAVATTERALHVARRIPLGTLVLHMGMPRLRPMEPGGGGRRAVDDGPMDSRVAARRSIEELVLVAKPLGVRIAVEVIPNELSRTRSLVHFVEEDLDGLDVGICLDFGHAHIEGDLVDAIETVAEHLIAVDLHDNRRRADEHLVPFEGSIEWPAALTAIQKVGYDGPFVFEIAGRGAVRDTLERARKARQRMQQFLTEQ
jgi:sugar phosphate isomerase/epimerase